MKVFLICAPGVILACEASSFRSWGHVGIVKRSVQQARRMGFLKVLKYVVQRMGIVMCVCLTSYCFLSAQGMRRGGREGCATYELKLQYDERISLYQHSKARGY